MKSLLAVPAVLVFAVASWASPEDAKVDDLVSRAISRNADLKEIGSALQQLGETAPSRLAEHVRGDDRNRRLASLVCLQFCWSDEARDAVIEIIPTTDKESRRLAYHLLSFQVPAKQLATAVSHLASSKDPEVANEAIRLILRSARDKEMVKKALSDKEAVKFLPDVLTSYYGRDLSKATRQMLHLAEGKQRASLIVALIHQQDTSSEAREWIVRYLIDSSAMLRDRAAEYLRWHGTTNEVKALRSAMRRERDPYAKASMQAAMDAMKLRYERFTETGTEVERTVPANPTEAYRTTYELLKADPTKRNRAHALAVLAGAEPFEPFWQYGYTARSDDNESRITERLRLQVLSSGYPETGISVIGRKELPSSTVERIPDDLIAKSLMPPLRDYFDKERESFGIHIGNIGGPFDNLHHVGDDTAWNLEHETVVAIGNGLVRRVCMGEGSWGGLVIMEHKDATGNAFCSLYSHLGPLVAVREGDKVAKGQKVGSLGRSFTREGGGFAAHIHFGIHEGPYDQAEPWITGYLSVEEFRGDHGWVDPQPFIRERSSPRR